MFVRTRVIFPAVVAIAPITLVFVLSCTRGTNTWRRSRLLALAIVPAIVLGYVLIVRDITAARTTSLALEQANEQLRAQLETIKSMQAQLREQVIRDPLTGLYNRLYPADALARELACRARSQGTFAVVGIDVDHFESVNDVHGHAVGDAILRSLGELLRQQVRPTDSPCRYGGEEFVIVVRDVTLELAVERIDE